MKLSKLIENPDNPSIATDEDIQRLDGKIKRVPLGLTAHRIAYVTDKDKDHFVVISGNKRLRVLKAQFGDDADLPDEYFQDVTNMSEAERHEFIVTANVSDGQWDPEMLLQQYDLSQLATLMDAKSLEYTFGKDLDLSKMMQSAPNEADQDVDNNETKTNCSYLLGNNVLTVYDEKSADQIRKLYVQYVLSSDEDYKQATPKI